MTSNGTVAWVDLSTTDVMHAEDFYGGLLGWTFDEQTTDMGTYVVARVSHGDVGGMMAQASDQAAAGVPCTWTMFVGTDHLDTTLATASDLGGSVLQPPLEIPGGARIAVVADPAGAVFALMESPASELGMLRDQTGAVTWVECLTRDPAASARFYEDLFGWKTEDGTDGYVVFTHEGERVGGLMAMPPTVPAEAPSYWLVYFAVADVAAACIRTKVLGGTVLEPEHDIDEGRFAVLADGAGAVFAVFETTRG